MNNDCEQCLEINNYCNECFYDLTKEQRAALKKDIKNKNGSKNEDTKK